MRLFVLFLTLFLSSFSYAQMTKEQSNYLSTKIHTLVNDLRRSKNVQELQLNDTLAKAADFHSSYMQKSKKLSHDQKSSRYRTPSKRVRHFKGKSFFNIGENVLKIGGLKQSFSKSNLNELALRMFNMWKKSPGHYQNMINSEYEFQGFGFDYNPVTKRIYATQVFARKGTVLPNQLSENAFGIVEGPDGCHNKYQGFMNLVSSIGNNIELNNEEVRLYFHNKEFLKKMFPNYTDGIAIDILTRDQFSCSSPNKLDVSEIYDGVLLRPFYHQKLFEDNEALGDFRLITKVGDLPKHLTGKDIKFSVVGISGGKKCFYSYQVEVPRKMYELRPIEPRILNPPKGNFKNIIKRSEVLRYNFRTSNSNSIRLPQIQVENDKVHAVAIRTYTSVDGDSIKNSQLHLRRAEMIKNHLKNKISLSNNQIKIDAEENWNKMRFQLNYFQLDSVANLSNSEIRKFIKNYPDTLNWQSLFAEQRSSTATIHYVSSSRLNLDSKYSDLRTAIVMNDANSVNSELYQLNFSELDSSLIDFFREPEIEAYFNSEINVVQNYSSILERFVKSNPYFVTTYLYQWLGNKDLNQDARTHLLTLYAKLCVHLLSDWDASSERLANVIHPEKVKNWLADIKDKDVLLNTHIAFILYYSQINDYKKLARSFDFIYEYFKKEALDQSQLEDLSLFCNEWSMYQFAIDLLLPSFNKEEISEENLFILAKTASLSQISLRPDEYVKIMLAASEVNQERWCEWLNDEFQLLRNSDVKKEFCFKCSEFN